MISRLAITLSILGAFGISDAKVLGAPSATDLPSGFVEALSEPDNQSEAKPPTPTSIDEIIQLDGNVVKSTTIRKSSPLTNSDFSPLQASLGIKTKLDPTDLQNLNTLWKTVIEKNPVIQFGLKQLSTPKELRYAHASVMSRMMGGLVSGIGMLPYVMGVDQVAAAGSAMGTNMVDRAMQNSKKVDPTTLPSDTELVELSEFVQTLRENLVSQYFNYKQSLKVVSDNRRLLDQLAVDREAALTTPQTTDDLMLLDLTQRTRFQSLLAMQKAKRHYLALERLVGREGISTLKFDTPALGTLPSSQTSSVSAAPLPPIAPPSGETK